MGRGSEVGEAMVRDPGVAGVSFTGSSAVGGRIASVAAARGAKYQLEMGGKNPVIVADDADLTTAVEFTVSGAMRSAGQKCTATSRVIVLPAIRARFREALTARILEVKQGHPLDPDTYLGPLVSRAQQEKVLDLIDQGRREGASVVLGGSRAGGDLASGHYVEPTVFEDVTSAMTIAQEEIFGPVIALMEAGELGQAIEIANGIRFGLSASVFTRDIKTALTAVDRLQAGLVRINEETAGVELQAPFGGMKSSSSHSREPGQAAKEFYTEVKTVAVRPV